MERGLLVPPVVTASTWDWMLVANPGPRPAKRPLTQPLDSNGRDSAVVFVLLPGVPRERESLPTSSTTPKFRELAGRAQRLEVAGPLSRHRRDQRPCLRCA